MESLTVSRDCAAVHGAGCSDGTCQSGEAQRRFGKDYNRHAYQWLPTPLQAVCTLHVGIFGVCEVARQVSKGDEIEIRRHPQRGGPLSLALS